MMMSEDPLGTTTRRSFLGAASAATAAATLTGSPATEAQGASSGTANQTQLAQLNASPAASPEVPSHPGDWTKPAAMAIPKEGYFKLEQGRYGPIFPRTPANYGFTIIAKIKAGREPTIREYGKTIEKAVGETPNVLAPLRLHYLLWVIFDIGSDSYFMYQGIFDTDFDKYLEDAVALFLKTGITTVFVNLEGWPDDWKTNLPAVIKFFRDHQRPSFLEYGEYPYVTGDEIKKALRLKRAFSEALDQMQ